MSAAGRAGNAEGRNHEGIHGIFHGENLGSRSLFMGSTAPLPSPL
jgi:hypothetical protein